MNKAAVYDHSRNEVKTRSSLTLLPASGGSWKINLSLRHVTALQSVRKEGIEKIRWQKQQRLISLES